MMFGGSFSRQRNHYDNMPDALYGMVDVGNFKTEREYRRSAVDPEALQSG